MARLIFRSKSRFQAVDNFAFPNLHEPSPRHQHDNFFLQPPLADETNPAQAESVGGLKAELTAAH